MEAENKPHPLGMLAAPVALDPAPGYDYSVAVVLGTGDNGSMKRLRRKTALDTMAEGALLPGERPTTAAVRMANALMLEQILGTGAFGNASELARAIGISKDVVSELLALLDTPVAEMERILFETR